MQVSSINDFNESHEYMHREGSTPQEKKKKLYSYLKHYQEVFSVYREELKKNGLRCFLF